MKNYVLVAALGVAITMVGTIYGMRGSKNDKSAGTWQRKTQIICLIIGTVFFISGIIGVVVSGA